MPAVTATPSTPITRQLSDGNTGGQVIGQSNMDLLGFFGTTPVPAMLQGSTVGINGVIFSYSTATLSPSAVAGNTSVNQAFTATGVASTDMVIAFNKPTAQAGLVVGSASVSGANTVQGTFANVTGTTVTPTAAESYQIVTVQTQMVTSGTYTPASVAANTSAEQNFAVTGAQPGMVVAVNKPTLNAGLIITGARVVSANVVGVTFMNVTAGVLTPTSAQSYKFFFAQGIRVQSIMSRIATTLTPASVAANTSAEQTFTVAGLVSGQPVIVDPPYVVSGVAMAGARVSATNTLAVTFANDTAAALTPATGVYVVGYFVDPIGGVGTSVTQLGVTGVEPGAEMARLGLTQ